MVSAGGNLDKDDDHFRQVDAPSWWLDERRFSAERFAEPAGEFKEAREPELISKTHRHLTFSNEPNQTLGESVKTAKPLQPTGAPFSLACFRSFLPHSQTALQARISARCVPETCLWLPRYSTLDESCLVVLMAADWPSPFLTPSSGGRNNCIVQPGGPRRLGLPVSQTRWADGVCLVSGAKTRCSFNFMGLMCFPKALLKENTVCFWFKPQPLYTNKCLRSESQPCVYTVLRELFGMDVRCFIYCFNLNGIINSSCRLHFPESAYFKRARLMMD